MNRIVRQAVESAIRSVVGNHFRITAASPLRGGCVDQAYRIDGPSERYFVKLASVGRGGGHLAAEAQGLAALDQAHGLRVPDVVTQGEVADWAFLVVEHLDLRPLDSDAMVALGEAAAELHGIVADTYGWSRDNRIGATPQRNARTGDWTLFWRENRLGYQLELAAGRGNQNLARAGEKLMTSLAVLLADHRPEASLVHGDFWSGNVAMDTAGCPVVFDPAVYYGDRETDLAMAELFGGFSPLFFEAYHGAWPLDPGYREWRRDLYQLYHLLNHDALFGGHYADTSLQVIDRLLAKL